MTSSRLLFHSSILIKTDTLTIYADPFKLPEGAEKADVIFVTHDHFDHFSPEDIKKVLNPETVLVVPEYLGETARGLCENIVTMTCGDVRGIAGITAEAVPAFNTASPYHPEEKGDLGYVINTGDERIFITGDTDFHRYHKNVSCDRLFVPVGGKFTMDFKAAAELTNFISPATAVPTHYGEIVGSRADALNYQKLVKEYVKVEIHI